jgi:hypothetical protein
MDSSCVSTAVTKYLPEVVAKCDKPKDDDDDDDDGKKVSF